MKVIKLSILSILIPTIALAMEPANSMNLANVPPALMHIPQEGAPDICKDIRPLIITMLLEDTSTLYPTTIRNLALVNKAWAKIVHRVVNNKYSENDRLVLAEYRPFSHPNYPQKNQIEVWHFIKEPLNNDHVLTLGLKRFLDPQIPGIDINAFHVPMFKLTLLHYMAESGNVCGAKLLIQLGAKVDIEGQLNITPLNYAAYFGKAKLVELLLSANANIESQDWSGATPLLSAVEHNKPEVVKILLDHGANTQVTNRSGETLKDIAQKSYHPLLRALGFQSSAPNNHLLRLLEDAQEAQPQKKKHKQG